MKVHSVVMRSLLVGALAAGSIGAVSAPQAGAVVADEAHCYGWTTHPDRWSGGNVSFRDGAAIRRGPYTDCTSFGLGYAGHGIDVHCVVTNANRVEWFWVRNTTTGVSGWVSENALSFGAVLIPGC